MTGSWSATMKTRLLADGLVLGIRPQRDPVDVLRELGLIGGAEAA